MASHCTTLQRYVCFAVACLFAVWPAAAQEPAADFQVETVEITQSVDVYGQTITTAQGRLRNVGSSAYQYVNLFAQAYNRADEPVAEGTGVLVNACGAGLVLDFVFQPQTSHLFSIPLEWYAAEALINRIEITATAEPVAAAPPDEIAAGGITHVSSDEVVAVEWEDENTLRYAVGCERALFTEWDWRRYELKSGRDNSIEHPFAARVTDDLRVRLQLADPLIFANSRLRFGPSNGTRLVYQDRINTIWTAAADGRLQRQLHASLNSYSLQGYTWLPNDRFMAYYYGAYGDPVLYFTADTEGRLLSRGPLRSKPSLIVPGVSSDGLRAIIGGTFDGVTGYYIDLLAQNFTELLFEAELPGNNFPPPVPLLNDAGDRVTRIYVIRTIDNAAHLQCFFRPEEGENALVNIAPVPLELAIDERAWSFLSPDQQTIALAANGAHGGLWLIDLSALPACGNTD
jgi:hypothetical protein